jgi:hypothetical protein
MLRKTQANAKENARTQHTRETAWENARNSKGND